LSFCRFVVLSFCRFVVLSFCRKESEMVERVVATAEALALIGALKSQYGELL
jgi:hypothetical protein